MLVPVMADAVKVQNLRFTFPGADTPVLDIESFTAAEGERLFLLGSSGSGKSTLLNILAGILKPQQGSVQVFGQALDAMPDRARDRFRARHIGYIFQQFNLIPYLDVESNIRLSAFCAGQNTRATPERIRSLLDKLQLSPQLLHRRADRLSVGQQQRVAVARAMVNGPRLIIADEPTSALDEAVKDDFIKLLLEIQHSEGATVIFVSHDQRLAQHFQRSVNLAHINRAGQGEARHAG